MQSCRAYGQLHDKKEVLYDEVRSPPAEHPRMNVQTEDRYMEPPKRLHTKRKSQIADNWKESNSNEYVEPNKHTPSKSQLYVNLPNGSASSNTDVPKKQPGRQCKSNPREYEEAKKCTPSEKPLYVNMPTDIASSNTDSEDAYEELISFIKNTFSPNQMDAMVTMLQSVKHDEEGSPQAKDSGTLPSSVPQPDHPPPPDSMVEIDIYPDVFSDDECEKEPEVYTDALTPPVKHKRTSFCRDFKSKEGILAFGMLLN